jgi:hypothetical protein
MSDSLSRRSFATLGAGLALGLVAADDPAKADPPKAAGPTEAPFERDYAPPAFKPSWKKPQLSRLLVQDFVIYAHSDLGLVKKLLEKEPALLNAAMDWGAGDWETGLGGASHMGRRDIAEYLLERGARIDLFGAAMLGQLEAVKAFLALQPRLVEARGPHGLGLHFHAQVGGKQAEKVLDYLQSIKKVELKPVPFLNRPPEAPATKPR